MRRFVLSSLTLADPPGQCRLHSRGFTLFARSGSLLLVLCLVPLVRTESIADACLQAMLVLAVACLLWFRSKSVVASKQGLIVGSGRRMRVIPWTRVRDIRELPWIRMSPPWYPRMWQIDLDRNERFDFCGVRNAREIVIRFVKQSEAHEGRT